MKLHSLEIAGFGPFLQRQRVDFDAFDDDGIFLIAGRTGAGKSSILDGVTFALYGGVPRYDGGAKRLRSDHCRPEDPTEVQLEFTVAERRWRVTRSPEYERPKKNGRGVTKEDHRALVEELVDGDWIGRAAKPREAAEVLDEILGLNREQFQQVILLAQNRFAQFLLARNDDRQSLLRTLFGTRRYEDYQRALEDRRKDAEAAVAAGLRGVESILDEAGRLVAAHGFGGDAAADPSSATGSTAAVPERLAALERALERGAYRVSVNVQARDAAADARDRAAADHQELARQHERSAARDDARRALAALEAETDEIAAARVTLDRARRAEALRTALDASDRADVAVQAAARAEGQAREAWRSAGGTPAEEDLDRVIEELTGRLAVWEAARDAEDALESLHAERDARRADVTAAADRIAGLEAQRATLPERRRALREAIDELAERAGGLADARRAREDAGLRRDAAREAQACAQRLATAEQEHLRRKSAAADAAAATTALLRRRVQERAGELAAALEDGAPCAVCGSLEHPHPAPRADEPVTDEELEVAAQQEDDAREREREAAAIAAEARTAHADATARAAGMDADSAQSAFDAAAQRLADAESAVTERDERRGALDALDAQDAETSRDLEAQRALLTEMQQQAATLAERLAAAEKTVTQARGDFETVAARLADGRRRRDLAVALRDAISALQSATAAADEAARERDTRIAESAFADASDARSALRDDSTRRALDDRISEHGTALEVQRARLMDLEMELAGAPDPLPDLSASAAALADARARADAATAAAAEAAQAVTALTAHIGRARAAHAEIAEREARHRLIAGVADAVAGRNDRKMDLETFVLAAELEQIVAAANLRLEDMSSGRYRLKHTDALAARNAASGLGLEIVDAFTGQARPAQSLSGGETFLASLALALGLAEVVTSRAGGIRLDTLFIDEGFGSLDPETLELAMRTLDELRQGGRTVGVISHVEAMKEQLPAQLLVEAAGHGPSTVRQPVLDPV
jgi:exonuclease SbcC